MALSGPRITKKNACKSLIYTHLIVFSLFCSGESGTWTSTQKRDNQLVTRYFFLGNQPGNLKNVNWRGKIGTEGSQRNKGKKLPEISQKWTLKFFFQLPKISSKRVFQPWLEACSSSRPIPVLATTREPGLKGWFWSPTPVPTLTGESGFQIWFRPPDFGSGSDPGARFSGLIPVADSGPKEAPFFQLKTPRAKAAKNCHHISWQIGKGIYIYLANLPIYGYGCFFADNTAFKRILAVFCP